MTIARKPIVSNPVTSSMQTVVPHRWQGEVDCLVGPFSSRTVADYFANFVVNIGDYGVTARQILLRQASWYVVVTPQTEASSGPDLPR